MAFLQAIPQHIFANSQNKLFFPYSVLMFAVKGLPASLKERKKERKGKNVKQSKMHREKGKDFLSQKNRKYSVNSFTRQLDWQ